MGPPRGFLEELHFLSHHQRTELGCEALNKFLVCIHSGPMRPTISIIIEFPKM
jgi:hypothetical protein